MKFLHTGDLHLDASFSSMGEANAEARRERQREVLKKIFKKSREESCHMILIAGDLFDSSFVSEATRTLFFRLVEESGIPVIVSAGNHDPLTKGSVYARRDAPENLYIFSSNELQKFDFPELDTEVFGYAFTSPVISESPLASAESPERSTSVRLLCAHGEFGAAISRYSPITASDVDKFGFDYAAMGHIHLRSECVTEGGTPVVYCGFAEGRSFDEEGEGGVYIVETVDGATSYEWHKLSEVMYVREEIDISGIADRGELVSMLLAVTSKDRYKEGTHMRLTLVGASDPEELYELDAMSESVKGTLLSLDIRNETVPAPSVEYLERDTTLRGELYRSLLPRLTSASAEERRIAVKALRIGLAAIDGRSVFGRDQ